MTLSPRTIGTASALFLIWPIIEVIANKCGEPDCLSKWGNYSLLAFAGLLIIAVLWSFLSMLKKRKS